MEAEPGAAAAPAKPGGAKFLLSSVVNNPRSTWLEYFGLPEDDRPTFEWFGKSEPWAPPTRTSPRRQELKPNTYFGM